ncbi:glycosyltransferase family 61 protein [Granulosicoccus antarcticus]|uniref:glycosyltransferase family 61 protein n=1 Tax=Granulosicoccus antarcticus TaxID=437505 RepID=UPI0012FD5A87|nr:glycosyltransferase family 61 protein [Granulosicoccus antarcticus]
MTYLVGANAEPNNFYHWNFQCLPGIVLLRAHARTKGLDYRIVVPPLNESRRRSLELADIDAAECVELKPDSFIMNVPILYTSAACGYYALQPSLQLIELLNPYLANCLSNSSSSLPTRFYLSRRDAPGKREIKNEKDLVGALKHRGYDELVMSELSIEDQVAAFARAESIVAPHGAGLVNLMFAPETARLLEILPENYRMAYFFRLSQVRGMRYSQVLSRVAGSWEGTDVHQCPVVVEIDKVLSTLDRSESASAISGAR